MRSENGTFLCPEMYLGTAGQVEQGTQTGRMVKCCVKCYNDKDKTISIFLLFLQINFKINYYFISWDDFLVGLT